MIDIEHAMNVSDLSRRMGMHMKLGELSCSLLAVAGMFHDIGKLSVPAELLEKPGTLSKEEYRVIQWHTTMGHLILSQMPDDIHKAAAEVAQCHHERMDGSGYLGLSGSQIPLNSRIVGVADVYDALVSKRPYRDAWTIEATLDFISAQTGKLFEPRIVEALKAVVY